MKILVKRVYEPVAKPDGFRVLIDRLWPRGLSKPDARLDLWLPDLGPSTALRKWFNHDPARWTEFCRRYHAELKKKTGLLATITEQAKASTVTLLYSAKDERHNQAVALRSFLVKRKSSAGLCQSSFGRNSDERRGVSRAADKYQASRKDSTGPA